MIFKMAVIKIKKYYVPTGSNRMIRPKKSSVKLQLIEM